MTLVISIASKYGLWQASDHRLVFTDGQVKDSSIKHLQLEGEDGKAMISYAGVGQVKNTEISDWLRRLLRGKRRKVEQHLGLITERATAILGEQCRGIGTHHTFSIVAFVEDEPRFYFITNGVQRGSKVVIGSEFQFHGRRLGGRATVIVNVEGAGAFALPRDQFWNLTHGTIQRRKRKATLGKDVMVSLARLIEMANQRSPDTVSSACLISHLKSTEDGFTHKYFANQVSEINTLIPTVPVRLSPTPTISRVLPRLPPKCTPNI